LGGGGWQGPLIRHRCWVFIEKITGVFFILEKEKKRRKKEEKDCRKKERKMKER